MKITKAAMSSISLDSLLIRLVLTNKRPVLLHGFFDRLGKLIVRGLFDDLLVVGRLILQGGRIGQKMYLHRNRPNRSFWQHSRSISQ